MAARRSPESRFHWISSSPSPAETAALSARFPDVVELPNDAVAADSLDWATTGLLARSLGRWFPPEAFVRELRRVGIAGDINVLSLASLCYLIKFASPEARETALNRAWTVNGQPVATDLWRPDFFPADDALASALLWIRLPGLPIEYWSEAALRAVVAAAGGFVEIDSWTAEKRRGGFARVCVRVEIGKPLRPGVLIRGSKGVFWQPFVFENVAGICPECGSLHPAGKCLVPPPPASNPSVPLFGPWMAAVRQRKPVTASGSESRAPPPASVSSVVPPGSVPRTARMEENGWQQPSKTSRRRTVPPSSSVIFFEPADLSSGSGAATNPSPLPANPENPPSQPESEARRATVVAPSSVSLAPVGSTAGSSGLPRGTKSSAPPSKVPPTGSSSPEVLPSPAKRLREAPRATKERPSTAARGKGKLLVAGRTSSAPSSNPPSRLDLPREPSPSVAIDACSEDQAAVVNGQQVFRFGEGRDHNAMVHLLKQAIQRTAAQPLIADVPLLGPQSNPGAEPLLEVPPADHDAMAECSPSACPIVTELPGSVEETLPPPPHRDL